MPFFLTSLPPAPRSHADRNKGRIRRRWHAADRVFTSLTLPATFSPDVPYILSYMDTSSVYWPELGDKPIVSRSAKLTKNCIPPSSTSGLLLTFWSIRMLLNLL